jgi:hypothetical protein
MSIAWGENNFKYEMLAYELLGKQHYYLGNVKKAEYYTLRAMRGYSEGLNSKTRELN